MEICISFVLFQSSAFSNGTNRADLVSKVSFLLALGRPRRSYLKVLELIDTIDTKVNAEICLNRYDLPMIILRNQNFQKSKMLYENSIKSLCHNLTKMCTLSKYNFIRHHY